MYTTSDFKKGLKVQIDGVPYSIIDFQHVKPGKGNQFTRTKLKNLITGSNLERTIKSGEKLEPADVMTRDATFLYSDDSGFHFMDQENYEQWPLNEDDVADAKYYLIENLKVTLLFFNERAIGLDIPKSVTLTVTHTEPGLKGATVTGGTKPATLNTGLQVQVPLHINEGDALRIDTGTGKYIERVNK